MPHKIGIKNIADIFSPSELQRAMFNQSLYRVEPGEIEQRLRAEPQVKEAVVVAHKIGDETKLCAFVQSMNKD
jgi:acyl-coenzyme A synthetase/AMP-(fatty) acid ligase